MTAASRPAVYIHAWSAASAAGFGAEAALRALSALEPPAPKPPFEEARLEAARARLLAAGVADPTRTEAELAALLEPLAQRFPDGRPPFDAALVFGTATSGLPETLERIRKGDSKADPRRTWLPMEIGRAAPNAARAFGLAGPAYVVSTACTAGAAAIASAARLLQTGLVKWAFAGGLDVLNDLTESGFAALGAKSPQRRERPFSAERDGLVLSEGGGMLLLSTERELGGRPAPLVLSGWGMTCDAHHISAPDPEGCGAEAAIRLALNMAGAEGGDVSFAILHGTATAQNDAMEAKALSRTIGARTPCASLKRLAGHQLAGAGAFGAAVGCELLAENLAVSSGAEETALPLNFAGEAPAPEDPSLEPLALTGGCGAPRSLRAEALSRVLTCAFAFGGSNAALLFEKR